jgi:hypothetical protein
MVEDHSQVTAKIRDLMMRIEELEERTRRCGHRQPDSKMQLSRPCSMPFRRKL